MGFDLALARIVHVLGGVIWVGSMFFMSVFLIPSVTEVGPDGAKVMAAMAKRKWMIVVPVIALLTMLSGIWLFWRASMGFNEAYMSSGPGRTYSLGGAMAILGFIIGITVTRPAMMKMGRLTASLANASPAERETIMNELQKTRIRGERAGKVIAYLLIGTVTLMALGRYV